MSEIKLTVNNFKEEVINSKTPVLVDFWATWCGPCQMIAPIISTLAEKHSGKIKVGKVNVDEESELAVTFNINSIPTMILFENGQVKDMTLGYKPLEELEKWLNKYIEL